MNKQNSTLLELKLYKITTVKTNGITKRRGTKKKGRRHARAQRLYKAQFKVSHYFVHRPKCTDQKSLDRSSHRQRRTKPSIFCCEFYIGRSLLPVHIGLCIKFSAFFLFSFSTS